MNYAPFRFRLGAHLLDIIVLITFLALLLLIGSRSQSLAVLLTPVEGLLFYAYTLYFHASSGQTLGKRWLGIKVVTLEGGAIGIAGSFRRNLIMLIESLPWIVATMIATLRVPSEQFRSLHGDAYNQLLKSLKPEWYPVTVTIFDVILVAEIASVLLTRKRRSLHDFVGGTVVVRIADQPEAATGNPGAAPNSQDALSSRMC